MEIYDDLPSETLVQDTQECNLVETLALYLTEEDQKGLCQILGRSNLQWFRGRFR